MAPEQIRAEGVDGRVDVYALGCMMYECITAYMPFEAPTLMALLSKHLLENAAPPSQRRRDLAIPPWIDELVRSGRVHHGVHAVRGTDADGAAVEASARERGATLAAPPRSRDPAVDRRAD